MTMATTAMHPELAAIAAIFEVLRRLPDRGAQERVMTYAKHLIDIAVEEPRIRTNGGPAEPASHL
jgi:hypothetical protein